MEVGKYTFAPNEAFCQLVARLHKSNNGGCFHHFTTINCRSFGDSFVNKMAHEDFFFGRMAGNSHNPTIFVNKTHSAVFIKLEICIFQRCFSTICDIFKNIRFSCLAFSSFDLFFF